MYADEVDADEISFRARRMMESSAPFHKPFYGTDNKPYGMPCMGTPDGRVVPITKGRK